MARKGDCVHRRGAARFGWNNEVSANETPNLKLQAPEKLKLPSSKTAGWHRLATRPPVCEWLLGFEAWDFSGVWSLGFGA